MYDNLPEPRLFDNTETGVLYLEMEWNGRIAHERIDRQFLNMDDDQKSWYINSHKVVQKLWKKLNFKMPKNA